MTRMKKLSESTDEELLTNKKLLTAVIIVSLIMMIAFILISYFTGYGGLTIPACIMIPNTILCYYVLRKMNKELKSRGL